MSSSLSPARSRSTGAGSRRRWIKILSLVVMLPCAVVGAAAEATVSTNDGMESGLAPRGTIVSDQALGEMRGMFITPQAVSFFSIQMASSWQGANGITTNASLVFSVDFAAGAGRAGTPQMFVSWSRDGDPTMDVAGFGGAANDGYVAIVGGVPIPVTSLAGVDGIVQSNVIAGADNKTHNAMSIMVVPAAMVGPQLTSDMHQVHGSVAHGFAEGDKVDFTFGKTGIGLVLTKSEGSDQVRQGVDSDLGRLAQQTVLNSNNNVVSNTTSLLVGVNGFGQVDPVRADQAMATIRLYGF